MIKQPTKTNKKALKRPKPMPPLARENDSLLIGPKRRFSQKLFTILSWGIFVATITFIILALLAITIFKDLIISEHFIILRPYSLVYGAALFIIMFVCALFKACRWCSFALFCLSFVGIIFTCTGIDYITRAQQKHTTSNTLVFGDTLYDSSVGSINSSVLYSTKGNIIAAVPSHIVLNDKYEHTEENSVKVTQNEPVSTFSIDVDTASYTNVRSYLENGNMPPKDAIRIEELINYFPYDYALPKTKEQPFAIHTTLTDAPWKKGNQLLHIGIKGYDIVEENKKPLNLVLLIDTSGSMSGENRIELLKKGFLMLVDELTEQDTISIITYSGDSRIALEPTKGNKKTQIRAAINSLSTRGSTWGAGGMKTAYELAKDNFDKNAINRILMGTDGDFNVGATDNMSLKDFVAKRREDGIYLSILSVGRGNYNDSLMQSIAQAGNGIAYYLDSVKEARRVLLTDINKTLFPIANDVKIQVEFNPAKVAEYRLIGYETRLLNREDFNNDQVDAGEIGSGHSVTAIYELTPTGSANRLTEDLRYGTKTPTTDVSDETAFVRVRYKLPEEKESKLIEQPIIAHTNLDNTSDDVRFSIAVAGFGQNLKDSKFRGDWSYDDIKALAKSARGDDDNGYRGEFIGLINLAKSAKTEPGF